VDQSQKKCLTAPQLAKLLHVTLSSLKNWRAQGLLPRCTVHSGLCYNEIEVNAFLANCKHNLRQPLTLKDLLSGAVTLLTLNEAMQHSGFSKKALNARHLVQRIHLTGRQPRFVQSSLPIRATKIPDNIGIAAVSLITGVRTSALKQLLAKGVLKNDSRHGRDITFHQKQVLCFLKTRLPAWIQPLDWFNERLASGLQLVSFSEAARQLGTKEHLLEAMSGFTLRYIHFGHSQLFMPESIAAFVAQEEIVSKSTFTAICSVQPITLHNVWIKKNYRICPLHDHTKWDYKKSCILAFLREALPHDASRLCADRWYAQQTTNPQKLVDLAQVTGYLGVNRKTVLSYIDSGFLRGLRLPSGSYKFTPRHLANRKSQLRNSAKR